MNLPTKERACVLVKDVFDYTLEEIADLVGSTVGGVNAALNRGRAKLAALPEPAKSRREVSPELSRLLRLYVDRFNTRDWDGLRELVSSDARSEEHTSELQSRGHLVCRLLLEKKKEKATRHVPKNK